MNTQEIIVYVIVAAAVLALVVKIRRRVKNKGNCCGCDTCGHSQDCGQIENTKHP